MGWWRLRSRQETLEHLNRRVCATRIGMASGNLEFIDGREVSRLLIENLPLRIDGEAGRDGNSTIQMLEEAVPGIADALYEWFEPGSKAEMIFEMISSWPGDSRHGDKEPEENS